MTSTQTALPVLPDDSRRTLREEAAPNTFTVTLTKETGHEGIDPSDHPSKPGDTVTVYVHPDGFADLLGLNGATVLCKEHGTNWTYEMCGA